MTVSVNRADTFCGLSPGSLQLLGVFISDNSRLPRRMPASYNASLRTYVLIGGTMTKTELDRYYDKKVVERDGVKGQICQGCQQWIPLEEKGQHFEAEHLR